MRKDREKDRERERERESEVGRFNYDELKKTMYICLFVFYGISNLVGYLMPNNNIQ